MGRLGEACAVCTGTFLHVLWLPSGRALFALGIYLVYLNSGGVANMAGTGIKPRTGECLRRRGKVCLLTSRSLSLHWEWEGSCCASINGGHPARSGVRSPRNASRTQPGGMTGTLWFHTLPRKLVLRRPANGKPCAQPVMRRVSST